MAERRFLQTCFQLFQMPMACKSSTPKRPKTEIALSTTVQVANVCFTVNPKYALNIQKPVSFTCDNMRLPAHTKSTITKPLKSQCRY